MLLILTLFLQILKMPRDSWRDTYRSLANKLYKRKSRSELQEKLSQTNQFLNHVTSGSLRNIPNSVIESAKRDRLSLRRRIGLATNERQRSTAYKRAANQVSFDEIFVSYVKIVANFNSKRKGNTCILVYVICCILCQYNVNNGINFLANRKMFSCIRV